MGVFCTSLGDNKSTITHLIITPGVLKRTRLGEVKVDEVGEEVIRNPRSVSRYLRENKYEG